MTCILPRSANDSITKTGAFKEISVRVKEHFNEWLPLPLRTLASENG
jgi:hypothetical protein